MTLGKKILELRKKKGLSQEALSEIMDVTRQTISNWELDETSPNPEQLKMLSKEFNVSIDELLDNDIENVIVEKVSNTEKLSGVILKLLKFIVIFIIVCPILIIILNIIVKNYRENNSGRLMDSSIECTLHNEKYSYNFVYFEETGGEGYLSNITDVGKYSDAYQALDVIDAYVKNNGGTCNKSEAKEYVEEN